MDSGRRDLLFPGDDLPGLLPLVDVPAGRILPCFFAQQGIWTGWRAPLWKQVGWSVLFVTSCEFITGIFVNKIMGWNVWDYTDQPFQILGQVCLPFTIIFSGLCAAGILLSGYLLHFLYGEKRPEFHVL